MQNKFFILIIIIVFVGVVVTGLFFVRNVQNSTPDEQVLTESQFPDQKISDEAQIVQPETLPSGTFPLSNEPIELSIERADATTILISWEDSQLNAFNLLVYDAEDFRLNPAEALVWAISSLKDVILPADGIVTDEDIVGFIPSEYMLGELVTGLETSPEPANGNLAVGKKYYLQVSGFGDDGDITIVNKDFTFTESCLPPDCQ